ncbi:MAG: carboxypeptidase regulatory-like domain-containing protein, partial [Bacteroidales bacterium]
MASIIRLRFSLIACALVLTSPGLSAQTVSASLVGIVQDEQHARIASAAIAVVSSDTGLRREVRASADGSFSIGHLAPGRYDVSVSAPGFQTVVERSVGLEPDQVRRLSLSLRVSGVQQEVVVTAPLAAMNTDTQAKGEVIPSRLVQALPLNGRNYADLVVLAPGAYHRVGQDEQGEGFSTSGARADSATFTLDGTVNRSDRNGIAGVVPPLDAVREFDVQTSTYGTESGRTGGAQVVVVSRSGSNRLTGAAFDYMRNDALDAADPFAQTDAGSSLRRHQAGGSVGGPIKRNRLFFFTSYERLYERRGAAANTTAPNQAWLNGDFRNVRGPGADGVWGTADDTNRLLDPLTRKEFATPNVVPLARFSPTAAAMLPFIPPANLTGTLDGYGATGTLSNDNNLFLARVDGSMGGGAMLSARWALESGGGFDPFPANRNFYPGFGRTTARRLDSAALIAMVPLGTSWVSETRVAYFGHHEDTVGENSGTDYVSQFGIPGLATDPQFWGFPSIRIDGFSEFGDRANDPTSFRLQNFQASQVFSTTRARHTLKTGLDVVRSTYSELDVRNVRGDFRFRGRGTNPASGTSSGFRSFADFLLGVADQTQRQVGAEPSNLSGWQMATFVQDEWRVRSELTVTAGVRYERQMPLVEDANRMANFVPDLGEVVQAGDPRYPRALVNTDNDNVAPRVGAAFRPHGSTTTVLRGGVGLYYSLETFNVTRQQLALSYPFVQREQYSRQGNNAYSLTFANPFPADRAVVQGIDQPLGMAVAYERPRYWQYNATLERQIGRDLAVELAYVGSQGYNLGRRYNLNQPIPTGLNADGSITTVRPFPTYADIQYEDQTNTSRCNALQVSARRRFTDGLSLLVAYTLGYLTDYGSISTGNLTNVSTSGNQKAPQNIYDMPAERGRSDLDRRHQTSVAFAWDLPFGAGRRWLSSGGVAQALAADWQLSGVATVLSGRPFTPQYSAGDFATQRPDLVGDPYANVPVGLWFNPSAFAQPVATAADPNEYGNAGRNILVGPGYANLDLALSRL